MKHIVITGGPHSGKTSFLPCLVAQVQSWGWNVVVMAEQATKLYHEGIHPAFGISSLEFHNRITAGYLEERAAIVSTLDPQSISNTVLISDRWIVDIAVYLSKKDFCDILQSHQLSLSKIMQEVSGVLHLESTAIGLEIYDNQSNGARTGTSLDQAKELEYKTKQAYNAYRGKRIIVTNADPTTGHLISAEEKLQRSIQALKKLIA